MEQVVLEATRRERTGKGPARAARRAGRIPGVVYGLNKPPMALSVDRDDFEHALAKHHGSSVLFDLRVDGTPPDPDSAALVKAVQRHPVTHRIESVDFQWVALTSEVTVTVPVVLAGEAQGAREGGVINQLLHEVEVSCRPLDIPDEIVVNIEGMELRDVRTVADLQLPPGVTVLADPDTPLVTCAPPATVAEEERGEEQPVEGEITSVEEE